MTRKKNRTCECCGHKFSTPQKLRQHYNSKRIPCKPFNNTEIEESSESEYFTADEGPDEYFQ